MVHENTGGVDYNNNTVNVIQPLASNDDVKNNSYNCSKGLELGQQNNDGSTSDNTTFDGDDGRDKYFHDNTTCINCCPHDNTGALILSQVAVSDRDDDQTDCCKTSSPVEGSSGADPGSAATAHDCGGKGSKVADLFSCKESDWARIRRKGFCDLPVEVL